MRYVGIDIASETHLVAVVDQDQNVLVPPTRIKEEYDGYTKLFSLLGDPADTLVAMEATGIYWQNILAALVGRGFKLALINPLRTRRFAQEDLARAKTDAVDALLIAKFASQKRLLPSVLPDQATLELRELVRLRDRLVDEREAKRSQLDRVLVVCFPEFRRLVGDLAGAHSLALLSRYPTASAFTQVTARKLAGLTIDERSHRVGLELAEAIIEAAKKSVGSQQGEPYRLQVRYLTEDLAVLRRRLLDIDKQIGEVVERHEIAKLLQTIDGIGPTTSAMLIAELGDIARFKDGDALAAYIGVTPRTNLSGKGKNSRFAICKLGKARVREGLYMPTVTAIHHNPWLSAFYRHLQAHGKANKVALIACMRKLVTAIYSVAKNKKPFEIRTAPSGVTS